MICEKYIYYYKIYIEILFLYTVQSKHFRVLSSLETLGSISGVLDWV